jgi:hypothetical protein
MSVATWALIRVDHVMPSGDDRMRLFVPTTTTLVRPAAQANKSSPVSLRRVQVAPVGLV